MAEEQQKPVRLVSSLMNLDSYSLYSRLGFMPQMIFQDMLLTVPKEGMAHPAPDYDGTVRPAVLTDVPEIARVERTASGIHRLGDWANFVANRQRIWKTFVAVDRDGKITGALSSHTHAASQLIGPGFGQDEAAMTALLWTQLDSHRGTSPVFLIPASGTAGLMNAAYSWGARNVELHAAQCRGEWFPLKGVVMPTFLPESF